MREHVQALVVPTKKTLNLLIPPGGPNTDMPDAQFICTCLYLHLLVLAVASQ